MKKYPLNKVEYYATFKEMIEKLPVGREEEAAVSWFTRKGEECGVTLGKMREDIRNLQAFLVSNGLAGKHIAILGENCYEWLLVYFAATYCGAVAVCVDVEQSDETLVQMLSVSDVSAMFFASSLEDICTEFAGEERKTYLLSGKGAHLCVVDLIEEGQRIRNNGEIDLETTVTPDMTASIVFTSGTTSISKPDRKSVV